MPALEPPDYQPVPPRQMTASRDTVIQDRWLAGERPSDIARSLSVSPNVVSAAIRRAKGDRKKLIDERLAGAPPPLTDWDRADIRRRYKTGLYSMPALAAIYNVAVSTIYTIVHASEDAA